VRRKKFRDTAIGRTLVGDNTAGRILHGVLDILPIPQVHDTIATAIKDGSKRNSSSQEIAGEVVRTIDYTKLIIGIIGMYLLISGKINLDSVTAILQSL